ncbi:MAG: hypothetical protein ACREUZ_06355, partial [Burkholderiales bacterium]
MARVLNQEVLDERARNLGALNGIRLVFVTLDLAAVPPEALLDLEFHNANSLADILNDVQNNGVPPASIFSISGGSRIRGGIEPGQVQVHAGEAAAQPEVLRL